MTLHDDSNNEIYTTISHLFLNAENELNEEIKNLELEWIIAPSASLSLQTTSLSLQTTPDNIDDDICTTMSYIFLEVENALDNASTHIDWSTPIHLPPSPTSHNPTSHNDSTTWRLQPPDVNFAAECNNQWSLSPSPASPNVDIPIEWNNQ